MCHVFFHNHVFHTNIIATYVKQWDSLLCNKSGHLSTSSRPSVESYIFLNLFISLAGNVSRSRLLKPLFTTRKLIIYSRVLSCIPTITNCLWISGLVFKVCNCCGRLFQFQHGYSDKICKTNSKLLQKTHLKESHPP